MQSTNIRKKSIPKGTIGTTNSKNSINSDRKRQFLNEQVKYRIDFIKKQNYDIMGIKSNITQIKELPIKYVLECIEGLFKGRSMYITTHKDGQIFGSGNAKKNNLTLQIQGVNLSQCHAQLKFDGFKSFNVIDYNSTSGTWMKILPEGVQIHNNDQYTIGDYLVQFILAQPIDEIQEICLSYNVPTLSDVLYQNAIYNISDLYTAEYNSFQQCTLSTTDQQRVKRICQDVKKWYQQGKKYKRIHMKFLNQPLKELEIEIGWVDYNFSKSFQNIFNCKQPIAQIIKGKLIPHEKVFNRILSDHYVPLTLHNQLKMGDLMFELKRFNIGSGKDKGDRIEMQDYLFIQEDIGGSQWKLVSLFGVIDGHGGPQCAQFIASHLIQSIKLWIPMLDSASDLNQMVHVLINRTFFEIDKQFAQKYPYVASNSGATILLLIIIQSRVFVISLGDCKGYLFRNQILYQLTLDHLPTRGDERIRIENTGAFIQYDRLMGKCTLSRCFGQFQYKNIDDYNNLMKGKLKSYLSCLPDVIAFNIQSNTDQFLLICTDGLINSIGIITTDFIMQKIGLLQQSPNKIVNALIQNCKIIKNDCDNLAIILIIIKRGKIGAKNTW